MLSKEDKKIKQIGVSFLTFIINELDLSFFQNVAKLTKRSFSLLYSILS